VDHLQDLMRRYFDAWASPYTSSGSTSVSCVIKVLLKKVRESLVGLSLQLTE